jgi:hypothetical protein
MVCWGQCPGRQRIKWRCPAKVEKWACPTPCSPSDYGRTFYTSTVDNPRLFPRIRRDMCQLADAWLEEAKKQNQLFSVEQWLKGLAAA